MAGLTPIPTPTGCVFAEIIVCRMLPKRALKILKHNNYRKKCIILMGAFTHNPEVVGSSPASVTKKEALHKECFFFSGDNGIRRERPDRREGKKHAGGMFFSSGENPWKADGTPQGVLATFHPVVHLPLRLCIVPTCRTISRNKNQGFLPWFFVFWD